MTKSNLPFVDKHVAFCGKLGGVSKREANRLVKNCGGIPVDLEDPNIDLVVLGADELPMTVEQEVLDDRLRSRLRTGKLEVISETQLWERLGLMDNDDEVQRLYTPAMVADLLKVPVACIRKWHRRGLINPRREVHRLPYFDFQEVSTARRLAEMVEGGASPGRIKRNLEQLAEFLPDIERPLAQLSIIIEGKNVLLRRHDGIVESNGQIRLNFEDSAATDIDPFAEEEEDLHLPFPLPEIAAPEEIDYSTWPFEDLIELACNREDEGDVEGAIEIYRAALLSHGPKAEVNFQLAELLYRKGEIDAARERYYFAIELDDEFVEARASLGCVLAELGQDDLAVSAFQGALEFNLHFPDVHFHLARTLDRLRRHEEAEIHWREFLKMSPESSWADEARDRLNLRSFPEDH